MYSFINKALHLWLFLLPFSWVIAHYSNFTAPDKLLAPVLILLGFFLTLKTQQDRINNIFIMMLLAIALLVIKHISFIGSGSLYQFLMIDDAVKIGYFLVPLLCISNQEQFDRAGWMVVVISIIGCLSVFLVAIDLLHLPAERFEVSRLGEGGLRKSIGLFRSYGDMAQYVSFAVLWLAVAPTMNKGNRRLYRYARIVMAVSVILGLAGAQSRNLLLSIILAFMALWLFRYLDNKSRSLKKLLSLVVIWASVILVFFLVVFSNEIISLVSHIGGGLASNTVNARLEQYAFAINLFKQSPLFGVDAETFAKFSDNIEYIHNMWLRLAAHGGLISILVLLLLFTGIFTGIRKTSYDPERKNIAIILSSYFIVMLFSSMFYVAMGEMYWALLGVAASYPHIHVDRVKNDEVDKRAEASQTDMLSPTNRQILAYKKRQKQ